MNFYKFIVFILLLSVVSGCNDNDSGRMQGYIEGEFSYVAAEVAGRVNEIFVQKGQYVFSGDKLIILDDEKERIQLAVSQSELARELAVLKNLKEGERKEEKEIARARIIETEGALHLAQSKLKKFSNLKKSGYVSSFEYEQIHNEVNQQQQILQRLKAEYDKQERPAREHEIAAQQARVDFTKNTIKRSASDLDRRTVYAPFSSYVYDVMYKKGEMAATGAALISLLAENSLKVRFFISDKKLRDIQVGQDVLISMRDDARLFTAKISFISPSAEYTPPVIYNSKQSKMVFMVEAKFDNLPKEFKAGLPVEVVLK